MAFPRLTSATDLPVLERAAWEMIEAACRDAKAPFRTPVLSTTGLADNPRSRIVVLREADGDLWTVAFHTDARSAKVAEIRRSPRVSLLFWDPASEIQLRLEGVAHTWPTDTAPGRTAFGAIPEKGRVKYRYGPAPETPVASADDVALQPSNETVGDPAAANFMLVQVEIRSMDYLSLAEGRQRRASLRREASGATTVRSWIAP